MAPTQFQILALKNHKSSSFRRTVLLRSHNQGG